jgi:hypothetical protein
MVLLLDVISDCAKPSSSADRERRPLACFVFSPPSLPRIPSDGSRFCSVPTPARTLFRPHPRTCSLSVALAHAHTHYVPHTHRNTNTHKHNAMPPPSSLTVHNRTSLVSGDGTPESGRTASLRSFV